MGSMVMSTFMMFVPQHVVFLFLAICCVGFFGIYIPYNESKKKGEVWGPLRWLRRMMSRTARRENPAHPDSRCRLDQLKCLKAAGVISEEEYKQRRRRMEKEL